MKKKLFILFISVIVLNVNKIHAQMAVTDPAMLKATISNWSSQLKQAKEQYEQMKEQTQFIQEGLDQVKKVNVLIRNSQKVKNIINNQVKIISLLSTTSNSDGFQIQDYKAHQAYLRRVEQLSKKSLDNLNMLKMILTDNGLKMNDYERLKLIDDVDKSTNGILYEASVEKKNYENMSGMLEEIRRLTSTSAPKGTNK